MGHCPLPCHSQIPKMLVFKGLVSRITIIFPSPALLVRQTSFLLPYLQVLLHEAEHGGDSLCSFTQKTFSFHSCSPALRAPSVTQWEWCQLLRKQFISWSNYLFRGGLYPKLIRCNIFSLFDLAWLQAEAVLQGAQGSASSGSGCCGQGPFIRSCCKRRCNRPQTRGFSHCCCLLPVAKWLAQVALGFVALRIFIPAGGNTALCTNNAADRNCDSGQFGIQRQLWALSQSWVAKLSSRFGTGSK